ncbi:MAG: hypothetical protein ABIS50_06315 [Luteolibacter sp.]|uniref:hypothetical protein n=1 Tax=Luteolibacter sp. TaxID=1962973 RepID=UPI003267217A
MDVLMLQDEIQRLPGHLQDRLAAFLTALRMRRDGVDLEIQRRLDDPAPENWKSWEQVKAELGLNDPDGE